MLSSKKQKKNQDRLNTQRKITMMSIYTYLKNDIVPVVVAFNNIWCVVP